MLNNHGAALSQQLYKSTLTARADATYAVLIEYKKNGKEKEFDVDVTASTEAAAFAKARRMLKDKVGDYEMQSESIARHDSRADDENYKGYKIYPAANEQFAVGQKGIIIKSKFSSIEDAKKWIDSRNDTLLPPNPELQSAMALGGPLAMEGAARAVDSMVEQLNSLGKEAEALVARATRADAERETDPGGVARRFIKLGYSYAKLQEHFKNDAEGWRIAKRAFLDGGGKRSDAEERELYDAKMANKR